MADHQNREIASGRGLLPAKRSYNPTVDEAMSEAIKASRGNLKTRADYAYTARSFGQWLNENRPGASLWSEITTKSVRDFLGHCRTTCRSNDIIRKRLFVVKMTSRYMAETYGEYGYNDVARPVRFIREEDDPEEARRKEQAKILPLEMLFTLLDYLHERRPDLHAIACLQGLAGMRAMEAAHVREQDIDFEAGTVTVTATPHHKPKNRASFRTIPVASMPLNALRAAVSGLKVRHPLGYLFATARRDAPWTTSDYSHAMRREVDRCRQYAAARVGLTPAALDSLIGFQAHWLRATFVTHAREKKVDYRVLQRYIGHTATDVMGQFYEIVGSERFGNEVVSVIEQMCEHCREHVETQAL